MPAEPTDEPIGRSALWVPIAGVPTEVTAATPLPVTGTTSGTILTPTTGTITNAASVVGPVTALAGYSQALVTFHGTYAGVNAVFEGSDDGATWYRVVLGTTDVSGAAASISLGANASVGYIGNIGGFTQFRVRATGWTSGTANVTISAFAGNAAPVGADTVIDGQYGSNRQAGVLGGGDAFTNSNGLIVNGQQMVYNGATWDRARGTIEGTVLASGSRSGVQTSADIVNYTGRYLHVNLNVTANAGGTGQAIVAINAKDPASGTYYPLLAGPAVTGNFFAAGTSPTGLLTLRVGPALTPSANAVANDMLPRTLQLVVTGTVQAMTYSLGYVIGV